MIFRSVLIFLICWQCIGGEDVENISIESIFDQIALPTKIISDFLQKPIKATANIKNGKKYSPSLETSTTHYENSNGFVPLIVPRPPIVVKEKVKSSVKNPGISINVTKTANSTVENNTKFNQTTKIHYDHPAVKQNRRSMNVDDDPEEFELLKVSNGTPAVANYHSYYDQTPKPVRTSLNTGYKKQIRNKDRDRGKRVQSFLGAYDETSEENKYKYSVTTEQPKKEISQPEKIQNYYRQDNTNTYRSQKSYLRSTYTTESTPKADNQYWSTSSKPSYVTASTTKSDNQYYTVSSKPNIITASTPKSDNQYYTAKASYVTASTPKSDNQYYSSNFNRNEGQKFTSPIVIQPNEYKVDVKFNGQTVQAVVSSTNKPQDEAKETKIQSQSKNEASEQFTSIGGNMNRNYESADSRDFSDENSDYNDDRSRRMQKTTKRRQNHYESSKKLPKEHREVYDEYDDQGRKRPVTRYKSRNIPKQRPVQVIHEEDQYYNEGDSDYNTNDSNNQQNNNEGNTWNQVAPNIEVSHSNGFELNQIEKPKLHILPVNILSNFDHATALDNSQGFDISNAMLSGFVHEGSLVSTASPMISSTSNFIDHTGHSGGSSTTIKPKMEASSSVPDVIVGQNSYSNPVQAVLMPHKLQQHMLNQYMQSTASPAIFAVTPSPSYASSTIAPQVQQMLSQAYAQPLTSAQRSNYASSPLSSDENDQIYVNPNGLQGQNYYQPTRSTTSRSTTERTSTTRKKKYKGSNGQYLASASLSVSHDPPRKKGRYGDRHNNKYNNNNNNNDYDNNDNHNYNLEQTNYQTTKQALNTYVQPTMIPAIIHTGIGLINTQNQQLVPNPVFFASNNPQMLKATNEALVNTMKQLQYGAQSNRYQFNGGVDSLGGASNVNPIQKAQLPIMGSKNVEIVNPNLNANAYAINQIPAAIVTTPIPIFTTTGFITPKTLVSSTTAEPPVSIQSIVNTLTEYGTKKPSDYADSSINTYLNRQNPDRQLFNPINFVPSYDLVKSQSILNSQVVPNEQFSQNLNLVPIIPGGNFFKHSQGAQFDLENKPKLTSDLERYAEEMFKESLRTIYNSHKWSNNPRYPNVSLVDNSEIAKLRNELLRIKNNLRDKLPKDMIEGHHSETKVRKAKPVSEYKRPKDSSRERPHKYKHHNKGHLTASASSHHSHHRTKPEINDYLTPPKVNSFVSNSPFHDKPAKKRPGHGSRSKLKNESRPRPRQGIVVTHKPKGLEPQASALIDYRLPIQLHKDKPRYSQPDYYAQSYNYPSFTTGSPENIDPYRTSLEFKSSEKDYFRDFNNQRTHNLMGLLMKNKQLPQGSPTSNLFERSTQIPFYDDENKKAQAQAYEDMIRSLQKRSDRGVLRPIPLNRTSTQA